MSWAAKRKTSIPADVAYSLLGLFGMYLSPVYGEGEMSAFLRLQQEVIKQNDDESILAWHGYAQGGRLFAPSPAVFGDSGNIQLVDFEPQRQETFISNKGLTVNLLLYRRRNANAIQSNVFYTPLHCGTEAPMLCVTLRTKSEGFAIEECGRMNRRCPNPMTCNGRRSSSSRVENASVFATKADQKAGSHSMTAST